MAKYFDSPFGPPMLATTALLALLLAGCGQAPRATDSTIRNDGRQVVYPETTYLLQNRWDASGVYEFRPKLAAGYVCIVYRDTTAPSMQCVKP